jgi:hypothetical protein
MLRCRRSLHLLAIIIAPIVCTNTLRAQEFPDQAQINAPETFLWLGFYGNFRLSEKFFWDAQMHYRRTQHDGIPYVGRMAQLYNRHALKYLVNRNLSIALGGVLRLDFTPDPGNENLEPFIPEPRIWHEYLFAMPFGRAMVYHRVRIEHRWSTTHQFDSDWIFRNRWRYKFYMSIPLNKPGLVPGAFFLTPDVEIIMQSGDPIIANPMEDLRINPSIGYIANPRVKYTAGMMYTMSQLGSGYDYRSRWVLRLNVYLSLDFRRFEQRIPAIHLAE